MDHRKKEDESRVKKVVENRVGEKNNDLNLTHKVGVLAKTVHSGMMHRATGEHRFAPPPKKMLRFEKQFPLFTGVAPEGHPYPQAWTGSEQKAKSISPLTFSDTVIALRFVYSGMTLLLGVSAHQSACTDFLTKHRVCMRGHGVRC